MTVRSAFQTLLAKCGQQFEWMLVPEYPVRRPKAMPLKVDGALLDTFRLAHGFWEALPSRLEELGPENSRQGYNHLDSSAEVAYD